MQTHQYSIDIHAPAAHVWEVMLSDETYRQWTSIFHAGSYFKGEWKEGATMYFLGPDPETNTEGGMISRIRKVEPGTFISIEHVGFIRNGVEDLESEEVKAWTPAFENYTFDDHGDHTHLTIDMDVNDAAADMFDETWPKALSKLKELAEK